MLVSSFQFSWLLTQCYATNNGRAIATNPHRLLVSRAHGRAAREGAPKGSLPPGSKYSKHPRVLASKHHKSHSVYDVIRPAMYVPRNVDRVLTEWSLSTPRKPLILRGADQRRIRDPVETACPRPTVRSANGDFIPASIRAHSPGERRGSRGFRRRADRGTTAAVFTFSVRVLRTSA